MIEWEDVYKVIVAMAPLYVALLLGYGSVKWWNIFTPDQCDAINHLVCFFTLPLFTFDFTAHVNPFKWNLMAISADAISKVIIVMVLGFWAKFSTKGSYAWSITSFSLCTLTNSLVVGVPLIKAMYGQTGVDLVVQLSVIQAIVWLTLLLFVLEFRRTRLDIYPTEPSLEVEDSPVQVAVEQVAIAKDVALEGKVEMMVRSTTTTTNTTRQQSSSPSSSSSFWGLMRVVWKKLAMNPNSYACIVGIAWAFIASRWHFKLPSIMDECVLIMSKAGTGTAMFSMGMFMARQEKLIVCGATLTIFGMVLRFIAGPAAMAIGAIAVGLHGDVLRVAIIQAALPQSITSFIYAKEYGLHADVLSTAVIFGMIVSLPVLIAYYAVLELVN